MNVGLVQFICNCCCEAKPRSGLGSLLMAAVGAFLLLALAGGAVVTLGPLVASLSAALVAFAWVAMWVALALVGIGGIGTAVMIGRQIAQSEVIEWDWNERYFPERNLGRVPPPARRVALPPRQGFAVDPTGGVEQREIEGRRR